jgi:hypothetical protein
MAAMVCLVDAFVYKPVHIIALRLFMVAFEMSRFNLLLRLFA